MACRNSIDYRLGAFPPDTLTDEMEETLSKVWDNSAAACWPAANPAEPTISLQGYSLMDEVARLVLASLNRSCHVRLRSDLWLPLLDDMPLTRVSLASCVHVSWAACHQQPPQPRL